ncbi:lysozyme inhibitor LprI family protein [Cronobacter dublinensis]|uniref:lysozyme inhibitor LprI family protein n=1 Tax=Cronobacter dublinensis TaxID=413497 RepID=UPI000CFC9B9A|nr:lysozyme inhibitor LprI family protein [Cronobacter dublinensis]
MKVLLGVVFNSLFLICYAAQAASSDYEQEYYRKINGDYLMADKELNHIYIFQLQEYKKEGAKFYGQAQFRDVYLKKSQLAWIKMRDASCDYETYESRTGTGFAAIYEKFLLDKTNERIEYLKLNN